MYARKKGGEGWGESLYVSDIDIDRRYNRKKKGSRLLDLFFFNSPSQVQTARLIVKMETDLYTGMGRRGHGKKGGGGANGRDTKG